MRHHRSCPLSSRYTSGNFVRKILVRFLFPSDYFATQKVDEAFAEQADYLRSIGFTISVIALNALARGTAQIVPPPAAGETVLYRGWMLASDDYLRLVEVVIQAGATVFTSPSQYLATHYLPNWYPLLCEFTPQTRFFAIEDNLEQQLRELGWERFFIKDYVKSLKTAIGSMIDDPSSIGTVVAQMQQFRGSIEGGLCVRQVEE